MSARVLLARLHRLGCQVRLDGDHLVLRRPAGVDLPDDLRQEMQAHRAALIALLRHRQDRLGRLRRLRDRALQRVPRDARNGHPALERYLKLLRAWAQEAVQAQARKGTGERETLEGR
jgi:hypothetical protein